LKSRMQEPVHGFIAGLKLVHSIKRRQKEDPSFIHVPRFPEGAPPPKWK
jgi:hypothetical protein